MNTKLLFCTILAIQNLTAMQNQKSDKDLEIFSDINGPVSYETKGHIIHHGLFTKNPFGSVIIKSKKGNVGINGIVSANKQGTHINIYACKELYGNGILHSNNIQIKTDTFNFTGLIICNGKCIIKSNNKINLESFKIIGKGKFFINEFECDANTFIQNDDALTDEDLVALYEDMQNKSEPTESNDLKTILETIQEDIITIDKDLDEKISISNFNKNIKYFTINAEKIQ
jgi:hypothetical protein